MQAMTLFILYGGVAVFTSIYEFVNDVIVLKGVPANILYEVENVRKWFWTLCLEHSTSTKCAKLFYRNYHSEPIADLTGSGEYPYFTSGCTPVTSVNADWLRVCGLST